MPCWRHKCVHIGRSLPAAMLPQPVSYAALQIVDILKETQQRVRRMLWNASPSRTQPWSFRIGVHGSVRLSGMFLPVREWVSIMSTTSSSSPQPDNLLKKPIYSGKRYVPPTSSPLLVQLVTHPYPRKSKRSSVSFK